MMELAEFIIANANATEECYLSVTSFASRGNPIDEFFEEFFNILDGDKISECQCFDENIHMQRAVILTFKYKNVKCSICEHFDTQCDYWCLTIVPC